MNFVLLSDSNGSENYVSGAANMASIIAARFGFAKINSSVSGNKIAQMTARVATDVIAYSPVVVVAMGVTNDAAYAFENGVPEEVWVADALADTADLIDALKAGGIPYIVISSPPPARLEKPCNEFPGFVIGLKALCASKGVEYAPVYEAFVFVAIDRLNASSVSPIMRPNPDKHHLDSHDLIALVQGDAIEKAFNSGCVWNSAQTGTGLRYLDANLSLQQTSGSTAGGSSICTRGKSSGKHYFELTYTTAASLTAAIVGVTRGAYNKITNLATTGADDYWYDSSGRLNTNGSPAESTGQTVWDTAGNTVGVKLDLDNMTLDFIDRNGATISGFTDLPAGTYYPIAGIMAGAANANLVTANFAGPFVHTIPTGATAFDA